MLRHLYGGGAAPRAYIEFVMWSEFGTDPIRLAQIPHEKIMEMWTVRRAVDTFNKMQNGAWRKTRGA